MPLKAEALQTLADIAWLTSQDLHLLHLNYHGTDFDTMHKKVLQEYYDKAAEDYDTIAECCLQLQETIAPPASAKERMKWIPQAGEASYDDTVKATAALLTTYCSALLLVYESCDNTLAAIGIQNTIQGIIEYWAKELLYFNDRRL